ncbi:TRAP transporter small transmembrane protein TeaB (substrate ectoine) [Oceanimonas sp. GK1]|uniref:TRAP transporter small permease n=1 Tax=Oceanimonas sp. (strain GK1 / IBRC-M 10197) TaxID=511062 RepID=UPI0002495177|nr:TRAP transporter small permease subunit [Oceanimonas sp. GK1]AEY01371.1 TRAP transporter small transmembrane protein TeaB (substrate ectoine) [Oceanimonas sp. GK1]
MKTSSPSRLKSGYHHFIAAINKVEGAILMISVLLMAFNNIANVVGRVFFNHSLFFAEEVNSILIILVTFAGTSFAARHGSHIRMTAIFDALPKKYQKLLMIIISFVTALCIFVIGYFSIKYILWIAPRGQVLPALQIPVYSIYVWAPISLFITGMEYFVAGIKNLFNTEIFLASEITTQQHETVADI